MTSNKKYIPPGSRRKSNESNESTKKANMFTSSKEEFDKFGEEKQYSLRVLNINTTTTEDEIKNLFYNLSDFPRIKKLVTATSHRGFIFMKFYSEEEMNAALPIIKQQRLNQMILDAELARPHVRKERQHQSMQGLDKNRHKKTGMIKNHPPCLFRTSCTWCILRDSLYQ